MSWTCPKCERELLNEHQRHWCARVSLDSLFEGRPAELILVFEKILVEVADWEGVLISTSPNCIVFVYKKTFFIIRPMQKLLDLKFYSTTKLEGARIYKSEAYGKKYVNNVRIAYLTDLNMQLFGWIKDSYKIL